VAVPRPTPVTTPLALPTFATTPGALLLHRPPAGVALSVVVEARHNAREPVIAGVARTVTVVNVVHPPTVAVNIIVSTPGVEVAVKMPEVASIEPTVVFVVLQVPAVLLMYVVLPPVHIVLAPLMAAGAGSMTMVVVPVIAAVQVPIAATTE